MGFPLFGPNSSLHLCTLVNKSPPEPILTPRHSLPTIDSSNQWGRAQLFWGRLSVLGTNPLFKTTVPASESLAPATFPLVTELLYVSYLFTDSFWESPLLAGTAIDPSELESLLTTPPTFRSPRGVDSQHLAEKLFPLSPSCLLEFRTSILPLGKPKGRLTFSFVYPLLSVHFIHRGVSETRTNI